MFLYYYTDFRSAIDDIDQEHIKLSRLGNVNDPNEWMPRFVSCDNEEVPIGYARDFVTKQWGDKYGFVSLSKCWNIAPMWGNYASKYTGVVFELECLEPKNVLEVNYQSDRPVCKVSGGEESLRAIVATKSQEWCYEQEVRYLHSLDVELCQYKNGLCFGPMQIVSPSCKGIIKLNRVICGPLISRENENELRQLCLEYANLEAPPITNTAFDQKRYSLIQFER